jgi:excisionase family DNA binding protein
MKEFENSHQQERLIPLKHVASLLGISLRTVWRMIGSGELPKPVQLGKKSALFASEVNAYFAKLKATRDRNIHCS